VIVDSCVTLTLSDVALNGTFVQVGAGANLDLLGAIHNNATLEADGGTIFANSNTTIDGTGNVIITGGGLAHFADVFNQDVTFAGPGTLQLDQSVIYDGDALTSSYTGTISGFGKGDTIDLTALNYSCTETDVWNGATHTLIISNGTQTQLLSLAGSYTQDNFALARDSSGGTEVVLSPTHVTLDGLDETAMPKKTIRSR
jgi:large repetitive protein